MEDNNQPNNPKVFISYSWSSKEHEEWVISLAEKLVSNGIDVKLDKWSLKEGQDKYVFMEQMVTNPDIKKVLCICDKKYQQKADNRKGGVGAEAQIITKEIYEKTKQEKFIPLIKEFDDKGYPCLPVYMNTRLYLDFSNEDNLDKNLESLVRNIFDKPLLKKPPLGNPPSYIANDNLSQLKTAPIAKKIKTAIEKGEQIPFRLINDYLNSFTNALEDFRIETYLGNPDFDKLVIKSITDYLPCRDEFIGLVYEIYYNFSNNIDNEPFKKFFEGLIKYLYPYKINQSFNNTSFDNYKFILYELFLYFIAILIKLKRYKDASDFIYADYFYKEYPSSKIMHDKFFIFNERAASFDNRSVSVKGDIIKERANNKTIVLDEILDVDALLYYLASLETNDKDKLLWFPHLVYSERYQGDNIDFFVRMKSRSHFEKIKPLFKVNTIDELKKKAVNLSNRDRCYNIMNDAILPSLQDMIKLNTIGTID